MNLEPFAYLFVFLLLAFLTFFARWLSQKVQEEIDMRDLFPPPESSGESRGLRTPGAPTPSKPEGLPTPSRPRVLGTRRRLLTSLHNKRNLRQGIVLMTVLGPCRALDPPSSK